MALSLEEVHNHATVVDCREDQQRLALHLLGLCESTAPGPFGEDEAEEILIAARAYKVAWNQTNRAIANVVRSANA